MNTDEIFFAGNNSTSQPTLSNFADRQKNLFDHLQKAESVNKPRLGPNETPMDLVESSSRGSNNKRKRSEMRQFRGKESIFKKPDEPLSKLLPVRRLPDFQKNPHKWTKYSLEDVNNDDISERANTHAALSFLRELETRKLENQDVESEVTFAKPMFRKTALIRKDNVDENLVNDKEQHSFKGSKIVMPEYRIGERKKIVKKIIGKQTTKEKTSELKLDHLLEDDEID